MPSTYCIELSNLWKGHPARFYAFFAAHPAPIAGIPVSNASERFGAKKRLLRASKLSLSSNIAAAAVEAMISKSSRVAQQLVQLEWASMHTKVVC